MIKTNLIILLITIIFTLILKKYNIENFKIIEDENEAIKNVGLIVKEINQSDKIIFPFNLHIEEYGDIVRISNSDIYARIKSLIIKNQKYNIDYKYVNNTKYLQLSGPQGNINITPSEITITQNNSKIIITADKFEIESDTVDIISNQHNIKADSININTNNNLKINNSYLTHVDPGIMIPFKGTELYGDKEVRSDIDKSKPIIPRGWVVCNMKMFHLKSQYFNDFNGYEYQSYLFNLDGSISASVPNSYPYVSNLGRALPRAFLLNDDNYIFNNDYRTYEPIASIYTSTGLNQSNFFDYYMYVPDMTGLWGVYHGYKNANDDNSSFKSAQASCKAWDSAVYIIKY